VNRNEVITTKKIVTTLAIMAVVLSLTVTLTAADAAPHRTYGREPTIAEKILAIGGSGGYTAALRIGLGSSEYVSGGQHFVIEQSEFENSDKILIIDYLNNPNGLGISKREGETHFRIMAGADAGREWQWAFSDPCNPSWTYSNGIWGDVGGFPASNICTDCVVEIHTHFTVGIDTETEVITIGSPQTPSPTPTQTPQICTPGERVCGGPLVNEVWECVQNGNGWQKIEVCAVGCTGGVCNNPPSPTPNIPGFEALIAIAGLLAVAVILLKRRAEA